MNKLYKISNKEEREIRKRFKEHIEFFKKQGMDALGATAIIPLKTIDGNIFAIVFGYMDGYDREDAQIIDGNYCYCLNGKVAYQPINSMMQEFDIDWVMPCDEESGEVFDSCLTIGYDAHHSDIDWLIENARSILKREYIIKEMSDAEETDEDECDFLYRMAKDKEIRLDDFNLVNKYEWAYELAKTHSFGFPDDPEDEI